MVSLRAESSATSDLRASRGAMSENGGTASAFAFCACVATGTAAYGAASLDDGVEWVVEGEPSAVGGPSEAAGATAERRWLTIAETLSTRLSSFDGAAKDGDSMRMVVFVWHNALFMRSQNTLEYIFMAI